MTDNNNLTAAQMLREARTNGRRKRELSTLSKLLCIREEYLEALEKGKYTLIPELVYILGFARNYAIELGLNPEEIVEKIKNEMGIVNEFESDSEEDEISSENLNEPEKATKKSIILGKFSKYLYKNWKWLTASVIALVIAIASISLILNLASQSGDSYQATDVVTPEPSYKQDVREKFGTENRAKSTVILQATQESWVKIEDPRGNTVFSRVLVPGDVYYVPAGDNFKATLGNAGGIDVWVNGDLIAKLGAAHERKSGIIMTPQALMPGSANVQPQPESVPQPVKKQVVNKPTPSVQSQYGQPVGD